jgi:O-antigen/teichoic acid export membrane protein
MNVKAALLRNTLWYALVTFIGLAAGLLMSIVLARGLGPARMGEYSYLLWAMRTMTAVASLGFALATVRYGADAFARGDANGAWGYVRLFLRGQIVTTFVVVAVLIPCILAFSEQGLRWSFIVIALSLFPITVEAVYTHAVYGAQRYDVTAQTSTVKMALQLLTSLLLVVLGFGVLGLFVGLALSYVASCLLQRRRALEI